MQLGQRGTENVPLRRSSSWEKKCENAGEKKTIKASKDS